MTKALTKAEKRRRKAARGPADPISACAGREPNGRRRRESVADTLNVVGRRRCLVMGWPATQEAIHEAARDTRLLTLPGRLMVAQRLSARASEAILKYAIIRERWLEAIGAPSEYPAISSYGDATHGHEGEEGEEWPAIVRKRTDAFMAAEGALLVTGLKPAVNDALAAGEMAKPMHWPHGAVRSLEIAGRALANHFGL